jgi:hypothetical protein
MMTKSAIDARKRRNGDDDPDDDELEDGQTYRIPLRLMDSLQRSVYLCDQERKAALRAGVPFDFRNPRPASLSDAQRAAREARNQMIDRQSSAWRMCHDAVEPARRPTSIADAQAMRRAAYDSYCSKLTSAWKHPVNPNPPPTQYLRDNFSQVSPSEYAAAFNRSGSAVMQPPRRPDNPEEMRRAALKARDDYLVNAWRNPGAAANAVEQARRRVTHEGGR